MAEAFREQDALTSVEIPGTVKSIADSAFYSCNKLSSIILHEGIEDIRAYAFYFTHASELVVPSTVKRVGQNIFYPRSEKATVKMLPITPPIASAVPFSQYMIEKIIVPAGTSNDYKTANYWDELADLIVEDQ